MDEDGGVFRQGAKNVGLDLVFLLLDVAAVALAGQRNPMFA